MNNNLKVTRKTFSLIFGMFLLVGVQTPNALATNNFNISFSIIEMKNYQKKLNVLEKIGVTESILNIMNITMEVKEDLILVKIKMTNSD